MKTNIKTKAFSFIAAAIGVYLLASPAYATCGVNGYWGSECGPQTPEPAPTTPKPPLKPMAAARCGRGCSERRRLLANAGMTRRAKPMRNISRTPSSPTWRS